MNITAILDDDLLFFHSCLSLANLILRTHLVYCDIKEKEKKEPID